MTPAPQDVQATFCATLVDEWARHGLRHAVIAPGSRSTPMALAIVRRSDVQVHVFHDERSASFAALGIARATRVPALLLCTSGTASTHFHAAVVEAHQSGVPMLVLTADRPPELHGVGAPQTIVQTNLYGGAVRWFHDPGVPVDEQRTTWRAVGSNAWARATSGMPGPVHLNLPFRDPLVGQPGELPSAGQIETRSPPTVKIDELVGLFGTPRGLIVAGDGVDDPALVQQLATATGWPIIADPLSGCQTLPSAVAHADALLRSREFAANHVPDAVLQLGMPPASKVIAQWLAATGADHAAVSPFGLVSDPNLVGAWQVHAPIGALCTRLAGVVPDNRDPAWGTAWLEADCVARAALDAALASEDRLSEPGVARSVTAGIRARGHLVVASSMPVRDVEWFGTPRGDITVHSNRGTNGIDGAIATAIGVAIGSGAVTTLLLGDIAFCHDMSSLTALRDRGLDLTIVVTDNDGGAIFSFLPQASSLPNELFETVFGTPHGTDIVEVARAFGLRAYNAETAEELMAAFDETDTCVVRVASNRGQNVAAHARLNAAVVAALDAALWSNDG